MLGSTAAVLVLFFVCVLVENIFVVEETSDLHVIELWKYYEYFRILVFEGSLSIELAL